PRKGRDGDRPSGGAPLDRQRAPALVQLGSGRGQARGFRCAARRAARAAGARAADPGLLATDVAEALVAEGVPFRDAHEQVARAVREGAFDPDSTAAESVAIRLGDVGKAVAEARKRFS